MGTVTKILWPSTDNCQLTQDDSQPFEQFVNMLIGCVSGLHDADQRHSARVTGILAGPLRIEYDYVESPEEVQGRKDQFLLQSLQQAATTGLSPDQITALLAEFNRLG